MKSFTMSRCWATKFLWPLLRRPVPVSVGDGMVQVRMGGLGGATIDVTNVASLSRMNWPWWGGLGARLGRKLVAFTTAWGTVAVIELVEPIQVRAPLRWTASRIVVSVDDLDGFLAAVAQERERSQPGA